MTPLEPGLTLVSNGGYPLRIESPLFTQAVGSIYAVTWNDRPALLKLPAQPSAGTQTGDELADLIEAGKPDETFLWPQDFVEISGVAGGILPPRPPELVPASRLLLDPARHDPRLLALAGRNLVLSVARLHLLGYAFRDFALGDVLLHPATGEVCLDVADRIAVDGEPDPKAGRQPRFLAPELIRGEALPGVETDLHLLAAALFTLLFAAHPLDGQLAINPPPDPATQQRLYGEQPRFICHPHPQAGQPTADDRTLRLWKAVPKRVRQCFGQTFTRGLVQPTARPSIGDWCMVLTSLIDALFTCGQCRALQAWCPERVAADGSQGSCSACGNILKPPPRLVLAGGTLPCAESSRPYPFHHSATDPKLFKFPEHVVMLTGHVPLYAFHTISPLRIDFGPPTAEVVPVVERPGQLALLNLGKDMWAFTRGPGAGVENVAGGQGLPVQPGVHLDFGGVKGRIDD